MAIKLSPYILVIAFCLLLQQCAAPRYDEANLHAAFCATPAHTCDWMQELLAAHPDARLVDICLPGAHDAGMYTTQHCTTFANSGNTQTQYLDMEHQLQAGIRRYDVRPELYRGDFYTHHSTHCDGLGCRGERLDSMLIQTRRFLDAHAEIVFLNIGHFCHTYALDSAFVALLTTTLGDRIYQETTATTTAFIKMPLTQIIPTGSHTGRVVLLLEGITDIPANRAKGYFNEGMLPEAGGWSNDNHYDDLLDHQLTKLAKYSGNGTALFDLAWQVTQHTPQAVRTAFSHRSPVTIRRGAAVANAHLPHVIDSLITTGAIHRGKIPNIIWDDLADTMVTGQCIKLSLLNLR